MSFFDLPGPTFIGVWLVGAVIVAIAVLVLRWIVARGRTRDAPEAIAAALHPTKIAYAAGGIDRAIEAAVAGLLHRGFVALEGGVVVRTEKVPPHALAADGVYRGVVAGVKLSRVEAYVLDQLPRRLDALHAGAAHVDAALHRELEERGVLVEGRRRATHLMRAPGYLWTLAGMVKVGLGIARDRPVFYLVMVLIGAGFALYHVHAPRLTSTGRALLAYVERRYAALESTARSAPQQLDAAEMTLAYGVFGMAVAPPIMVGALPVPVTGSSCGAVSCGGCSGGCGGGGCGGCGGCSS